MALGWNTCRLWASGKVRKALHEVLCSHQAGSWLWELLGAPRLSCHQLLVNSCLLVRSQPCNNHSCSRSGKQSLLFDACRLVAPWGHPWQAVALHQALELSVEGWAVLQSLLLASAGLQKSVGNPHLSVNVYLLNRLPKQKTRCQSFLLFKESVYVSFLEIWNI